ncbi:TetR family transcriptional regulator [Denitratisoma oestradiolicum]|uniref:TetR family transcriptional regulator n=1 Tax=Denitratisoma oestradiolicum TaxID=311182 RepID=A0A6S6XNN3_9PROT|nr:TetR family transcriptional regulator [Denitratisoma oestradiolicum]CAB1367446.1 TetR family transcriptional regulator [Denitratisoma oestradiolicum]
MVTRPAPASRPRQRRKEARPGELVAAALALFVEKGYAATRLDDVAARAGVSKGTLYLYFDNKEALFKAVIQEDTLREMEDVEALVARHSGSARGALEALLTIWWQRSSQGASVGILKLMVAEAGNFPEVARYYHDTVTARARELLRGIVARGIEEGEFRPVDLESTTDVLVAPILMLSIWGHSLGSFSALEQNPENYLKAYLSLLFDGGLLAAPTP